MKLEEAYAKIEAKHKVDTDLEPEHTIEIHSGGTGTPIPALYASPELACQEFAKAVLAFLRRKKAKSIRFVDGPHLDKMKMTMTDSRNQHRVAEPRWNVTCRIGF